MKKFRIYALAAFTGICALFTACDDNIPGVDEFEPVPLTDITLDPSLYNGIKMELNATRDITGMVILTPSNASDRAENFSSDNLEVATVDGYGLITAVGVGNCVITISVGDFSVDFPLEVIPFVPIHIVDMTLTKTRVTLGLEGLTSELDMNTLITLYPADANDELEFTVTGAEGIVNVSADGVITGLAVGTTTVTVTSQYDAAKTLTLTVEVVDIIPGYIVGTFAGTGAEGYLDGALNEAKFTRITAMAYDAIDESLLVIESDTEPRRLRRIKDGVTETLVKFNTGDVQIGNPRSIEFSVTGDTLFVANDTSSASANAIIFLLREEEFKIAHNYITTAQAGANNIVYALTHPIDGTLVYYSFTRKVFAWDAQTETSKLLADFSGVIGANSSGSLRFSPDGQTLYVVVQGSHTILSAPYSSVETALSSPLQRFVGSGTAGADDGRGTNATLNNPMRCIFAPDGNMYLVERGNNCVRLITQEGDVSLFAGMPGQNDDLDGKAEDAKFFLPHTIAMDGDGVFYVSEYRDGTANKGNRIRMIESEF